MKTYTINNEDDYLIFVENMPVGILDHVPCSGPCDSAIKEELEYIDLKINFEWARKFYEDCGLDRELSEQDAKEFILWMAVEDAREEV